MPTNGFSTKPLKVQLLAGEQKATEVSINGKLFSGSLRPDGEVPNGSIHWVSDENITGRGWKLCPNFTRAAEVNEPRRWKIFTTIVRVGGVVVCCNNLGVAQN